MTGVTFRRGAWAGIADWLARPAAWVPVPGPRHQKLLSDVVHAVRPTGNLVPDAHLAALGQEHGLSVVSAGTDFAVLAGITWLNPIGKGA